MTAPKRRSTIAIILAATILGASLVVGGVAGQTATETPNATATPAAPGTANETPAVPTAGGPGAADGTTPAGGMVAADGSSHAQDVAFMRVAHVSPDAGDVDVYIEGERALADVAFGDVSAYMTLPADDHNVTIAPAGANESAGFSGVVDLDERSATTLFAAGEVGANATEPFDPVRYRDDAFRPAANESAVSVSHMSPGAPPVDITADGGNVVIAENISFKEASQYASVPAGTHTIEIRQTSSTNDGPIVATTNVTLEGGTAYSAIAIGYVDANQSGVDEPFRVVLTEDATKTVHLPAANDAAGPAATPDAGETPDGGTATPTENETGTTVGPTTTEEPEPEATETEETPLNT